VGEGGAAAGGAGAGGSGKGKDMDLVNLDALTREMEDSDTDEDEKDGGAEVDLLAFAEKFSDDDSSSDDGNPGEAPDVDEFRAAMGAAAADGNPGTFEETKVMPAGLDAKEAADRNNGITMAEIRDKAQVTDAQVDELMHQNERINYTQRLIAKLTNRTTLEIWIGVFSLVMVYWGAVSLSGSAYILVFYETRSLTAALVGGNGTLLVCFGLLAYSKINDRAVKPAQFGLFMCLASQVCCYTFIWWTKYEGWNEVLYGLAALQMLPVIALLTLLAGGYKVLRKWGRAREVIVTDTDRQTVEEEAEARQIDVHRAATAVQKTYKAKKGRERTVRQQEYLNWLALKTERLLILGLSYGAIATFIAVMFYINMIFGVKFTPEQSEAWIIASFISFFIDLLLQQPLGFVMRGIVVAFLYECKGGPKKGRVLQMGAEGGGGNFITVLA